MTLPPPFSVYFYTQYKANPYYSPCLVSLLYVKSALFIEWHLLGTCFRKTSKNLDPPTPRTLPLWILTFMWLNHTVCHRVSLRGSFFHIRFNGLFTEPPPQVHFFCFRSPTPRTPSLRIYIIFAQTELHPSIELRNWR